MNKWYTNLKKSPLSPPSWMFSVVWPILYTLMFIALIMVWTNKKCSPYCITISYFMVQLFFNLIWTTLFFEYKMPRVALFDLILVILFTIITIKKFYKISKYASYLLVPYIAWLSFAFYLNSYIVFNN